MPLNNKSEPPYYSIVDKTILGVYECKWYQTSGDAPEVTVYKNTLGANIIWTRTAVGQYRGQLTEGEFGPNTFIEVTKQMSYISIITQNIRVEVDPDDNTRIRVETKTIETNMQDGLLTNVTCWLNIKITNQN